MSQKPTVVLIPGLWVGPQIYSSLARTLSSPPHNLPTLTIPLPSTGQSSPPYNASLHADVKSIRAALEPLVVDEGKDVVLVMHSAAGFLGSNAIEGLGLEERRKKGEKGGVGVLVFLAAGILEEGVMHEDPPFMVKNETSTQVHPFSPLTTLFSHLPADIAAHHLSLLQPQPSTGWNDTITYAGWKHVPSIFVIPEDDQLLPPHLQEHFAKTAGSEVVRVKDAGHMVMLAREDVVVEVVERAAGMLMEGKEDREGRAAS